MIDDPMNKLKVKRGSELPSAKLTEHDVILIRQLIEERRKLARKIKELSNKKIAEKFGVHLRTIDRVSNGETWRHVD